MFPLSNYRNREAAPLPHPRTVHLPLHVDEGALEGAYSNDHYYDPPGDALAGFCSLCRCLFCPTWCALRDFVGAIACTGYEVGSAIWESFPGLTLWSSYQERRNNGRITPYIPPPLSEPSTPSPSTATPSRSSLQLKNGDGVTSPFQVSPRYEVNYQQEGFVTRALEPLSPPLKAARPPSRVPSPFSREVWRKRGQRRPRPPKTPYPPHAAVEFTNDREKW